MSGESPSISQISNTPYDVNTPPCGMPPDQKRPASRSGYWIVIFILSLMLIISVFANLALFLGFLVTMRPKALVTKAADEYPRFEEYWSYGEGEIKAVRISLQGIITRDSEGGFLDDGIDRTEKLVRQIRAAHQDDKVKAIILEIDSPGGVITPTDEIYQELQEFRASHAERRVVVFVRDMAASGAYYVAMASDWIISEPTAVIGSIGVIMQTLNWKELSEKIGIRGITLTAGDNKDLLNPFKEVDPEHLNIFQDILDDMHARFVNVVRERLTLEETALADLADGRVFIAEKAVDKGMIDQLGYWNEVLAKTRELLGDRPVRVVRYKQPRDFSRFLARLSSSPPVIRLSADIQRQHPRMMYLWTP